jgi:hypothetical protein
MIRLPATLQAWGSTAFETILCQEVAALGIDELPLQQGLTQGSHALDDRLHIIHLSSRVTAQGLVIRIGIYFTSVVAGCNCADDPTPIDTLDEYCVAELRIDTGSALTTIALAPD